MYKLYFIYTVYGKPVVAQRLEDGLCERWPILIQRESVMTQIVLTVT